MPPLPAARAGEPGAAAGRADVLAGEAAANEAGLRHAVRPQPAGRQVLDPLVAGHVRPMTPQHAAGERVGLAERGRAHPGALEAERQPADAAEQVKDVHAMAVLGKNT